MYRDNFSTIKTKLGRLIRNTGAAFLSGEATDALQMAHEDIVRAGPWPQLYRFWTIDTIARYNTGTVTTTYNSTTVTGSGTTFTSAMVGRKFRINGDSRYYTVATFVSATSITLNEVYANDDLDGSGKEYMIYQDEYNLPIEFDSAHYIKQDRTPKELVRRDLKLFYFENPLADQAGIPEWYDITEHNVESQPPQGTTTTIESTVAGDGSKVVLVRGVVSGVEDLEEITLNADATSPKTSSKSYTKIEKISKQDNTFTGKITVKDSTTTLTLHTIPPEFLSVKRKKVQFYYIPKEVTRKYIAGWRIPYPLINDYDVPDVNPSIYIIGGLAYLSQLAGEWEKAQFQFQLFSNQLEAEKNKQNRDPDSKIERMVDPSYSYGVPSV